MSYAQLMYLHLATVVPAALIGGYLLAARKGTPRHRGLGRVYMVLMLITALITLFMPATVGPQLLNHFGWIHVFCVVVLISVPRAFFAIRRGDRRTHQWSMAMTYLGAILIAGGFAFAPDRYLHDLLFVDGLSARP